MGFLVVRAIHVCAELRMVINFCKCASYPSMYFWKSSSEVLRRKSLPLPLLMTNSLNLCPTHCSSLFHHRSLKQAVANVFYSCKTRSWVIMPLNWREWRDDVIRWFWNKNLYNKAGTLSEESNVQAAAHSEFDLRTAMTLLAPGSMFFLFLKNSCFYWYRMPFFCNLWKLGL